MNVSKMLASVTLLLLIAGNGYAQNMYTCIKNGKKVMTDQPCADLGAQTHSVRGPESFQPPTGLGGLTEGERRLAAEAKQRDAERDQRIQSQGKPGQTITTVTTTTTAQGTNNKAICAQLEAEKKSVIAQQRANSTDWLTQRHREINDEMYRRRCETF